MYKINTKEKRLDFMTHIICNLQNINFDKADRKNYGK